MNRLIYQISKIITEDADIYNTRLFDRYIRSITEEDLSDANPNTYMHNGVEYSKRCKRCNQPLVENMAVEQAPQPGSRGETGMRAYKMRAIGGKCEWCEGARQRRAQDYRDLHGSSTAARRRSLRSGNPRKF